MPSYYQVNPAKSVMMRKRPTDQEIRCSTMPCGDVLLSRLEDSRCRGLYVGRVRYQRLQAPPAFARAPQSQLSQVQHSRTGRVRARYDQDLSQEWKVHGVP